MAFRHAFGPIAGSYKSPRQTMTVWDDTFAALDEDDVVAYANTIAPASLLTRLLDDDPGIEELAGHIYRFELSFSPIQLQENDPPPQRETGTLARRANFQAQPVFRKVCLEPIGVYSADGNVTSNYPNLKWLVNVRGTGFDQSRVEGQTFDPLPEVFTFDYYAPNLVLSNAYLNTVAALCGKFNSGTFFDFPQGSVQLVRFSASERTPEDWELSFGFGYFPPQTNVQVSDDITIPNLRGSWAYWTQEQEIATDLGGTVGEIIESSTKLAVVQRVWEEADLSGLDLPDTVSYP
jgi:hypothetical protein